MGQQPNVPQRIENLPRPTSHPGPARRWRPDRPGDLSDPEEVPWGGPFGTPAPDAGYALRLLSDRPLPGGDDARHDVTAAVAAVMAARASSLGRAPVAADVDAAIALLGLESPSRWAELKGIAHDHRRLHALVATIPGDEIGAPLEELAG